MQTPYYDSKSETRLPDSTMRTAYVSLHLGILSPIAFGVGYQIDSIWGIGIRYGGYWISGGTFVPNSGGFIGIKISQRVNGRIINNFNYEITPFIGVSTQRAKDSKLFFKGVAIDVNAGNESALDNGVNFIWSVGVVSSFAIGLPPLFLPNLKLGLNYNF